MVRKKRPEIVGKDPSYTSDFSVMQPLPTNKPPASNIAPITDKNPVLTPKTTKPTKALAQKILPKTQPAIAAEKPVPAVNDIEEKREISIAAAVKVEQNEKLLKLETNGVPSKDTIALAGRRAIKQFKPEAKFKPKPDANRMPMRQGYKSTKRLPVSMLDMLREQHDPLRLQSDAAMVRGQFEPLFWQCLDEVIEELSSKYAYPHGNRFIAPDG